MPLRLIPPGTRKGNPYYLVRGTLLGRQVEVSAKTADPRAAKRFARELERRAAAEPAEELNRNASFAAVAHAYLSWRDPCRADRQRIAKLVTVLGRRRARDIRQVEIVDAANQLYRDRTAATKNREAVRPAAAILHYAAKNGICEWMRIAPFREPRPKTRAASTEVAQLLFEAAPSGDRKLFLVWSFCQGTRISDTLRVCWEDIDLAARSVRIRISKTDLTTILPLHAEVIGLLSLIPAERRIGRIFPWGDKSNVYRWLRPLVRSLGIDFTPHMARHSVGTWMAESGASLRAIMSALGHASVQSSMRYQSVSLDVTRAEMAKAISFPNRVSPKRKRAGH